jgi:aminoglycoside phosphotransferase (APT) family kinase protein
VGALLRARVAMTEPLPPDPDVAPCREDERLDADAVGRFLDGKIPGASGTPDIWQFPGGHANLTYLVVYPSARYVLRRPPHGDIPKGAHDMGREYRTLSALWKGFPPAPRAYVLCEDTSVIGAPFFVMERRYGVVVRRDVPPQFGGGDDPVANRKLSEVMIDTLADFHAVDYRAVGLDGLGKPDGFLARQVKGWTDRWVRSRTKDVPDADRVIAWLESHMPASPAPTLVHNDWRLDNMAVADDDPGRCVAVYDWDMCTIGDPLTDLGTLLSAWFEPGEDFAFLAAMPSSAPGFMTRAEAIVRYGARSGRDVSTMPYYYVFGLFKIAVVIQQLYYRWFKGQTKDQRMAGGEMGAEGLMGLALRNVPNP